jgi:small GTP-binding protein
MIGLHSSGKTTILYKIKNKREKVVTAIPTIGFNLETTSTNGTVYVAWDVGGREKIRPLVRKYYERVDGIIFVIDSSVMTWFDFAKDQLFRTISDVRLYGKPLLVLCNKQDLAGAVSPSKICADLGLVEKCKDRKWNAVGCSATTTNDNGLKEGLDWLSKTLQDFRKHNDDIALPSELSIVTAETEIDMGYDPTEQNLTLEHFQPIKNQIECPFAKSATLWGGYPSHDADMSLEEQADANVPALTEFVRRSNSGEKLDGFCIELNDPIVSKGDPKDIGECVRRVLTALSENDPADEGVLRSAFVGTRGWNFCFNQEDFFATTFAPCYPPTSSRYAFGTGRAFLLLQPEMSFARHGLPPDTPTTNWEEPKTIRDKTRLAFRKAGREYYIPKTTRYPPAEHIVKPLHDDGVGVVKWWNA